MWHFDSEERLGNTCVLRHGTRALHCYTWSYMDLDFTGDETNELRETASSLRLLFAFVHSALGVRRQSPDG